MSEFTHIVPEGAQIIDYRVSKNGSLYLVFKRPNRRPQSKFVPSQTPTADQLAAMTPRDHECYRWGMAVGTRKSLSVGLAERDRVVAMAARCGIPAKEIEIWTRHSPAYVRRRLLAQGLNTHDLKEVAKQVRSHGRDFLVEQQRKIAKMVVRLKRGRRGK